MRWLWPVVMLAILSELLWTASAEGEATTKAKTTKKPAEAAKTTKSHSSVPMPAIPLILTVSSLCIFFVSQRKL